MTDPSKVTADHSEGPPYTHTLPSHGPWRDCGKCDDAGWRRRSDGTLVVCWECRGEGGWYEPLPPPSYTITDVEEPRA